MTRLATDYPSSSSSSFFFFLVGLLLSSLLIHQVESTPCDGNTAKGPNWDCCKQGSWNPTLLKCQCAGGVAPSLVWGTCLDDEGFCSLSRFYGVWPDENYYCPPGSFGTGWETPTPPAPTSPPTESPTKSPTTSPTKSPTTSPTLSPTLAPVSPTQSPTLGPTTSPTPSPTNSPTTSPTLSPTLAPVPPTQSPTTGPTTPPTPSPTKSPTTPPTLSPTPAPVPPTQSPTTGPTTPPTTSPTKSPTTSPTHSPTTPPTAPPTASPTLPPTTSPTKSPTSKDSLPLSRDPFPTIPASDRPQFITITFDDSVTPLATNYLRPIVELKDKNGCNVKVTYYVSIEGTNTKCELVQGLYKGKNEIATHTLNHIGNPGKTEIIEAKNFLKDKCKIPEDEIIGFRAPFLQWTSDTLQHLSDLGFTYDTSIPINEAAALNGMGKNEIYPFTFEDASLPLFNCDGCPGKIPNPIPGLWEIPMWLHYNADGSPNIVMDYTPASVTGMLDLTLSRRMNGNRAPIGIFLHSGWLQKNSIELQDWIKKTLDAFDDVHFVTSTELLDYMRNPQPKSSYQPVCPSYDKACLPPGTNLCSFGKFVADTCECICTPPYCRDGDGDCTLVDFTGCPGQSPGTPAPAPGPTPQPVGGCEADWQCSFLDDTATSKLGKCISGQCEAKLNCQQGTWNESLQTCQCNGGPEPSVEWGTCIDDNGACTIGRKWTAGTPPVYLCPPNSYGTGWDIMRRHRALRGGGNHH